MDKHVDFSSGYVVLSDGNNVKKVYIDFNKYPEVELDL